MRVSVVVPARDAALTIGTALTSALRQTQPPDEIVVVDDRSSDGTAEVVRAFGAQVRLMQGAYGGPSAARNAGVRASGGDWIAFLDADDEWHPFKLEHQLRLAGLPEVVIVATDWARQLPRSPVPSPTPISAVTTDQLVVLNRFQTSTVLLSRETFDAAGGFDPSLDGVEDWDLWLRASGRGSVLKIDWPLVRYTDTETGYSKALARVYNTGRTMLERRCGDSPDSAHRAVLAWHHLRFAVAFALLGDRRSALRCLAECHRAGLTTAAPVAAVRHLAPFLARRARLRISRRSSSS